jgi:hypothetical protein
MQRSSGTWLPDRPEAAGGDIMPRGRQQHLALSSDDDAYYIFQLFLFFLRLMPDVPLLEEGMAYHLLRKS